MKLISICTRHVIVVLYSTVLLVNAISRDSYICKRLIVN